RCGLAQSSGVSRTVVRFGRSSLPWRPLSRCYTPHDILLILRLRYTHTPSVAFLYLVWYNKTISMAIDYTICCTLDVRSSYLCCCTLIRLEDLISLHITQ